MELRSVGNSLNEFALAQSEQVLLRSFFMDEIWKDVVGYEGLYKVSNIGNIKNRHGKVLSLVKSTNGYYRIILSKNKRIKSFAVHRLIFDAFIGIDNSLQINHIDGVKTNNNLSNLEQCNLRENTTHYFKDKYTGTRKSSIS